MLVRILIYAALIAFATPRAFSAGKSCGVTFDAPRAWTSGKTWKGAMGAAVVWMGYRDQRTDGAPAIVPLLSLTSSSTPSAATWPAGSPARS